MPTDRSAEHVTGWPPGLLQDDSRALSQWFASRPDAPRLAREAALALRDAYRARYPHVINTWNRSK